MEATHAPPDRSTPWVLGITAGVALAYAAMLALIAILGWLGVPEDRFNQI